MSFGFNSQISKRKDTPEYTIQIETDNYEQFLFIQEMARECVDGKHKKKKGDTETFAEHYGCKTSFQISIQGFDDISKYEWFAAGGGNW